MFPIPVIRTAPLVKFATMATAIVVQPRVIKMVPLVKFVLMGPVTVVPVHVKLENCAAVEDAKVYIINKM